MGFTVPPNSPYQEPLFPIHSRWRRAPVEGDQFLPLEIDWGSVTNSCVRVDAGNSTTPFSQIVAITVDNTNNGSDVEIIFLDSGYQLVVAAYAEPTAIPVFTSSLTFYVNCPNVASSAVTRLFLHNSVPPPVQPLVTQQQQFATHVGGFTLANGSLVLIPAGVNGTITGFNIIVTFTTTGVSNALMALTDGAGNVVWEGNIIKPTTVTDTIQFNMGGLRVPFRNGLDLVISGTANITGVLYPNIYYGVP